VPAEVRVLGADRLAATLEKASKQIADMSDGYGKAAEIVSGAGASSAPRRTGRLAGSMTTERAKGSATITSPLVYAVPIHWGRPAHNIEANPFLMRAADRTEAQWVGAIDDEVQRICNEVEGA
jgi:phage gpG-like protein